MGLTSPWVIVENWGSPIPYPSEADGYYRLSGDSSTVLSYVLFARGIEVIGPTATSSYVGSLFQCLELLGVVASRRGSRGLHDTRIHSDCIRSYRSAKETNGYPIPELEHCLTVKYGGQWPAIEVIEWHANPQRCTGRLKKSFTRREYTGGVPNNRILRYHMGNRKRPRPRLRSLLS